MSRSKVAITLDSEVLARLDDLVTCERFRSRSRAIEEAVQEKLTRLDRSRLARECAKLEPEFEQQMADAGLYRDLAEWPEY